MEIADIRARLRERLEAAKAEAAALQNSGQARVEDLSVFKVKKETKKGMEHEISEKRSCKPGQPSSHITPIFVSLLLAGVLDNKDGRLRL